MTVMPKMVLVVLGIYMELVMTCSNGMFTTYNPHWYLVMTIVPR